MEIGCDARGFDSPAAGACKRVSLLADMPTYQKVITMITILNNNGVFYFEEDWKTVGGMDAIETSYSEKIVEKYRCCICFEVLNFMYNVILHYLEQKNLLTEDHNHICCSCNNFYLSNPNTQAFKASYSRYLITNAECNSFIDILMMDLTNSFVLKFYKKLVKEAIPIGDR